MSNMVAINTDTLKKMARYIELTQPVVEKSAQLEQKLSEAAGSCVDALVAGGIVAAHTKEAKVQSFIEKPSSFVSELTKLASAAVTHKSIGGASGDMVTKPMSANEVFVDRLLGNS
jgi:hypothetical protein